MTDRAGSSPGRTIIAFGSSAALWLVAAGGPGDQPVARWVGVLIFQLVAALLIRYLYIRPQKPRPRTWSWSVFLIAAGVALLGRFNQPS